VFFWRVAFRYQYITIGQRVKPAWVHEATGELGDEKANEAPPQTDELYG